jgi:uncharacterized protein YjiS (DUF1127 family)
MPTRPTNLPSATGRDAAGRGHDDSVALVKNAMDDMLAAARADAAIAAPDVALPEKDAAGAPVPSTRSVLNLLQRYWRTFQERRQRHGLRIDVRDLSARELKDIGLPSAEIERIAAHRAIDRLRDGTAYLWRPPRGER